VIESLAFLKETMKLSDIRNNIRDILDCIPSSVKLISVSKTRSLDEMEEAYQAGSREFGENKVQELLNKFDNFHTDVKWHLIGHLQRNKVKYIVGKVSLIHSLDSIELLNEIEKRFEKENQIAECLIQINIGEETSKTGVSLRELQNLIEAAEVCKNVKIKGLMAIIPTGDEAQCRKYFREMKLIWDEHKRQNFNNISMEYLSMGMTGDYKLAIEEGANVIRVGEGIFGKRLYNNK
jgi:PLP dependent protein